MTYDQLLMIQAVVEQGGFGKAAKFLHISQPSITNGVKKVEEAMGFQIFNREEYRPKLTQAGGAFYQQTIIALREMERLKELGQSLAQGVEPKITIAINDSCPVDFILNLLKDFFDRHDRTKLELLFEGVRGAQERVEQGVADLGLTPLIDDEQGLEKIPLGLFKLIPVCAPCYPAAKIAIPNNRNMRPFTQVIVRDTSQELPDQDFGVIQGSNSCTVNDHVMKMQIIKKGLGWGRLPNHLIEQELANGELHSLESPDIHTADLRLNVIRLKNRPRGPVSKSLWDLFSQIPQKRP